MSKTNIPTDIKETAEIRYPEHISVVGGKSDQKQRHNQRIFIEGAEYGYSLRDKIITQQASTIEALKDEIMELRDSKLKDVKEINEQDSKINIMDSMLDELKRQNDSLEAEIERLKGLIVENYKGKIWYSERLYELPGHKGFDMMDNLVNQFKTENNL